MHQSGGIWGHIWGHISEKWGHISAARPPFSRLFCRSRVKTPGTPGTNRKNRCKSLSSFKKSVPGGHRGQVVFERGHRGQIFGRFRPSLACISPAKAGLMMGVPAAPAGRGIDKDDAPDPAAGSRGFSVKGTRRVIPRRRPTGARHIRRASRLTTLHPCSSAGCWFLLPPACRRSPSRGQVPPGFAAAPSAHRCSAWASCRPPSRGL